MNDNQGSVKKSGHDVLRPCCVGLRWLSRESVRRAVCLVEQDVLIRPSNVHLESFKIGFSYFQRKRLMHLCYFASVVFECQVYLYFFYKPEIWIYSAMGMGVCRIKSAWARPTLPIRRCKKRRFLYNDAIL